jgi:hypothetical protein
MALPTDFGHIIGNVSLIDSSDNQEYDQLVKISKDEYDLRTADRLLSSNQNRGVPKSYCIYGKELFISPVPDKTTYRYQINYTSEDFAEITSATADVPFSDRYRNVLRCGVLAELFDGMENFDEANYWRTMYTARLLKIKQNDDDNVQDDESVAYRGI